MLEVGNLVKYLPMTSAWVEILVHWGGEPYSAVVSCVILEIIN